MFLIFSLSSIDYIELGARYVNELVNGGLYEKRKLARERECVKYEEKEGWEVSCMSYNNGIFMQQESKRIYKERGIKIF